MIGIGIPISHSSIERIATISFYPLGGKMIRPRNGSARAALAASG
jgi:hypothetical protein